MFQHQLEGWWIGCSGSSPSYHTPVSMLHFVWIRSNQHPVVAILLRAVLLPRQLIESLLSYLSLANVLANNHAIRSSSSRVGQVSRYLDWCQCRCEIPFPIESRTRLAFGSLSARTWPRSAAVAQKHVCKYTKRDKRDAVYQTKNENELKTYLASTSNASQRNVA